MALSLLSSLLSPNITSLCQWAASLFAFYALYKISKYYMKWRELVAAFQPFPGPPCHWLYGNAREFLKIGEDLNFALHWAKTYKYGFPLWLGNFHAWLVVTHPDYAKTILSRQDPKDDAAYRFIVPWIGEGLLVLSGPKWFRHRRLLTPGFYYVVLKPYVGLMADCTKTMLDKWENLDQDKSVELFHYVSLMTLDSIMKCAFGYHSNCQTDSDNDYIKAVYELSYEVDFRFRNFLYHNDFIYNLSSHGRRFRKAQMIAHQHTDKVIKERIKLLHYERGLDKSIRNKRLLDFLDILLCAKDENGKRLSHKDLRAEVDTFMFEGHDTTASGISWIFYCMAKHPEHQEKCREEIREVLEDRDTMELEDLAKIPYTTMCIKESLRLYPPVPGIARKLSKPITFCDGRSLPEGSLIILSIYCINKSSLFWKDPEVFDPLRFSVENSSDRHPHAFLPFAAGPRNCIGQNFAMNEMKVAVALTLQRFQLLPDPENEPIKIPQIVLRSLNGIHIKLKKIERDSMDNTPADIDQCDV